VQIVVSHSGQRSVRMVAADAGEKLKDAVEAAAKA
jgi:hypothetical protein